MHADATYDLHMLSLRMELAEEEKQHEQHSDSATQQAQQSRIRRLYEQTVSVFSAASDVSLDPEAHSSLWHEYEQWERGHDDHAKANHVHWRAQRACDNTAEASVEISREFD